MNHDLKALIEDANVLLDRADAELFELGREPDREEHVESLLQVVRTIKEGAALLGYARTEALANTGEELLALVATGRRPFDAEAAEGVLRVLDGTRAILRGLEHGEPEPDDDLGQLIDVLSKLKDVGESMGMPYAPGLERRSLFRQQALERDRARSFERSFERVLEETLERTRIRLQTSETTGGTVAPPPATQDRRSVSRRSEAVRVDVERLDRMAELVDELGRLGERLAPDTAKRLAAELQGQLAQARGTPLRPALIVTLDGLRYAIPQEDVVELVRCEPDRAGRGIELVNGRPQVRLRGRRLPLVSLREQFSPGTPIDLRAAQSGHVVVLAIEGRTFGVVVDGCVGTQEILEEPLDPLGAATPFAGATLLEGGTVVLVLDTLRIAASAELARGGAVSDPAIDDAAPYGALTPEPLADRPRLLLFVTTAGTRMAAPLAAVARLQSVAAAAIEEIGQRRFVRRGTELLPLIEADEAFGLGSPYETASPETPDPTEIHVAVRAGTQPGAGVGLALGRVLDVVDAPLGVDLAPRPGGVLDVILLAGAATQLVDLETLFDEASGTTSPDDGTSA